MGFYQASEFPITHAAREQVGAEPGDLASEASYEPGQRPPALGRS